MPGKETVFISYRRNDSAKRAQQLRDQLAGVLGEEPVFFDKDMRPGTDFPSEISQALAGAQLILVLIGPGWLEAMKDKAAGSARTDWVLEEVQAALERLGRGERLWVIPLLLPGASMPEEGTLPAALGTLWRLNADHLKAQAATVPPDTDALLALLHHAGLVQYQRRDDAALLADFGRKVERLCLLPHMAAISSEWKTLPDKPSLGTDIPQSIVELANAIRACREPLGRLEPRPKAEVLATCQSLLTLLCNMAADFALAKHWQISDGLWVVPSGQAGHAVNLVASTLNAEATALHPQVVLEPDATLNPVYANVIDTGVPGIGSDRQAHLHAALWLQLRKLPEKMDLLAVDYPRDPQQPLVHGSPDFDKLKGAVEIARLLNFPVIAAHEVKSASPSHLPVRADAAQLGLAFLAYGPQGLPLTRFAPVRLTPARLACQQTINNILAP